MASPHLFPRKLLGALTVVVVLAHLAVLRVPTTALSPAQSDAKATFSTRTIEPPPPKPATLQRRVAPARPAPAKPRKKPAPAVPAAAPVAAPAPPAPPVAAAPPAATAVDLAGVQAPPIADASSSPEATPAPPLALPDSEQPQATAAAPDLPAAPAEPADAATRLPPEHFSASGAGYAVPDSVRLLYQVQANKFPYNASGELHWQHHGENYEARMELSSFGRTRTQSSHGQITSAGLEPLRFSDKYRTEVAAHFNREQGKVTFSANTPEAPLLSGAQDRLSVMVQLASLFAGNPDAYPPATTLTLPTIGARDADLWLFTVGTLETLELPGGQLAAIRLVRNPRRPYDQKVELWLAPALGYLPARLRVTESNGNYVDQQWLQSIALP